jgi:hypothetical protein
VLPTGDNTPSGARGWNTLRTTVFAGWRTWNISKNPPGIEKHPDFLVWSRASWPALQPVTFWHWWLTREATQQNGVLSEWSSTPAVVATRR